MLERFHQEQLDARLDHIVDTQGVSYDEARRQEGVSAPDNSLFAADRIRARNAAHQANIETYHLQTDEQRAMTISPEEQVRIDIAKQAARQAIERSKER